MKKYLVFYNVYAGIRFKKAYYKYVGNVEGKNKKEALYNAQRDLFTYKEINTASFGSNYPFKISTKPL